MMPSGDPPGPWCLKSAEHTHHSAVASLFFPGAEVRLKPAHQDYPVRIALSVLLIVTGIIHLLPVSGVVGGDRLAALYGIRVADPDLAILMRHRAVLFGLLGLLLIWAAFDAALQLAALVLGLISVASFLWLAHSTGGYNAHLRRVYRVDLAALLLLIVATLIWVREHSI